MNKILNFRKSNAPFEIRNKSETKAEVIIYAAIGASFWEDSLSAKQFSDQLQALPKTVNEIDVRINSPGGDVFDGISIYNRLKQHSAKKTVYIDGLAASIASIIALAGDEIIMGEGALFMIHLPMTMAYGNRTDFDNITNRLNDVEEQLISIYRNKTGMGRSEIKAMLEKETWLDADQTIEMGFANKKSEEQVYIAASALDKATWIMKKPKLQNSQEAKIKKDLETLKNKISGFRTRK